MFFRENLDHPYPNDEEKIVLAKKCGISVDQVSNWQERIFISSSFKILLQVCKCANEDFKAGKNERSGKRKSETTRSAIEKIKNFRPGPRVDLPKVPIKASHLTEILVTRVIRPRVPVLSNRIQCIPVVGSRRWCQPEQWSRSRTSIAH